MFAEEVLLVKNLRDGASLGVGGESLQGHGGNFFNQDGVVSGVGGSFAPAERSMACDESARYMQGIAFADAANDGQTRVVFVVVVDLRRGQGLRDRDGAVEIVGVGGAKAGDFALRLSPSRGGTGMRVGDATDRREGFVENEVSRKIGGGTETPFDGFTVEIDDNKVLGFHGFVADAAGLNDHEAVAASDAAGVAEGEKDEAAAD